MLDFSNFLRFHHRVLKKAAGKLAQHWARITLLARKISALRVIALRSCAEKLLRKCPQKPGDEPRMFKNSFFWFSKFLIFSTPRAEIIRIQILLFSNPLALTRAVPSIVSMRCYRKNYQKPPWAQTNSSIFKIHPKKSHICPENRELKLAQHWPRITLEHLQESALRVIALRSCAEKLLRKCP